ncbi:Glutamine-rich protein 2 [Vespula maculifrons]|uniref:Glutamine-rich protein 2 n=1 Tax=Vespula maculifrons TaxID=7453 RepID=A0ABD2CV93_VESMC
MTSNSRATAKMHPSASHYIIEGARAPTSKPAGLGKQPSKQANQTKPSQIKPSQAKPSRAEPSQAKLNQAKPSQTKPSQAKPSQAVRTKTKIVFYRPSFSPLRLSTVHSANLYRFCRAISAGSSLNIDDDGDDPAS